MTLLPKLIVMVGLQGSGKTTIASKLANKYDAIILSSDSYRIEFPSYTNDEIFKTLYADMNKYLSLGKAVIFDATNNTIKARKQLFSNLKEACYRIAYIVNTPIDECRERLDFRNKEGKQKEVPLFALESYHRSFQVPFMFEGWDEIVLHNIIEEKESAIYKAALLEQCKNFDQKNKWHKLTLDKHMEKVAQTLKEATPLISIIGTDYTHETLCEGAEIHDIGKIMTQTFDGNGQGHYYNHAEIGAYWAITNLTASDILGVVFVINYHMLAHDWVTDKAIKKAKEKFGEHNYALLKMHAEADQAAGK